MRKFNVKVNGKSYVVEVEETDGSAQPSAPISPAPAAVSAPVPVVGGTTVKAPMQGVVLRFSVANGATVKKGDKVVVLEAMKMENDIVASADGVITFLVKQGDSVVSGADLASIK